MKTNKVFYYFLFLLIFPLSIYSQSGNKLPKGISDAFRDGNSTELSAFFNNKIELILPTNSDIHSKQQAQFMMRDFFQTYSPKSFNIIHEGIRENATFAIGKLTSARGNFRVVILTKNEGGNELIHQLRIEKQDD